MGGRVRVVPEKRARCVRLAPGARTLTVGQVAAFTDVAAKTVTRWVDTGALVGHRLPGSADRRVYVGDLVAFCRRHGLRVPRHLLPAVRVAYGLLPGECPDGFVLLSAFGVGAALAESVVEAAVVGDAEGLSWALACAREVRAVEPEAKVALVCGADVLATAVPAGLFAAVFTRPVDPATVAAALFTDEAH